MSTFQKYDSTTLYTDYLTYSSNNTMLAYSQCNTKILGGNAVYIGLQNDNNEFIGKCDLSSFNSTSISCEEGDDWTLVLEDIDDTNTAAKLMYSGTVPSKTTTRTFNIKSISGKELFVTLNVYVFRDETIVEPLSTVFINSFTLTSATDIILLTTYHGETINYTGAYTMLAWQPTSAMIGNGHTGPIGFYYTTTSDTSDIEGKNLSLLISSNKLTYSSGTQYSVGSSSNFAIFNIAGKVYKDFANSSQMVTDSTTIYVYYNKSVNLDLENESTLYLAGSFTRKGGGCYTLKND